MLTATHLSRHFADRAAVQDVSLTLLPGQIMALVGASGSGKSTLLNLLAGLLDADQGDIRLDGVHVPGPGEVLVAGHPQIRVVAQDYQLMPNISIRENISYALRFYERTYREARVDELLTLCRLEAIQKQKPRETSGGEKQRAAIARALAEPARVLLLDEPFSHLDQPNRQIVRDLLLDLVRHPIGNEQPPACLFVTHDATDALSIADQLGVLQAGQLLRVDTPRALYANPGTAYAGQLTGPINLLRSHELPLLNVPAPADGLFGLRPEHLQLTDDGPVAGIVQAVFFQGAFSELLVQLGEALQVRLLTLRDDVSVGDAVHLAVNEHRLIPVA